MFFVGHDISGQYFNFNQGGEEKVEINTDIALFPNPTAEYFTLNDNSGIKKITIHHITGSKLKSFEVKEGNKYNVSSLKKGIYIVRLFDKEDQMVKALRLSKT